MSQVFFVLQIAEIADAMERRIIGVVVAVRAVDGGAAEVNDVIALNLKVDILEADLCHIMIAVVMEIADHIPVIKVFRGHQREKMAGADLFRIVDTGSDRVVSARYRIIFHHEFGVVGFKVDQTGVGQHHRS